MVLHNHILASIMSGLDFTLAMTFTIFLFWVIIGVWKVLEETFGTDKALLIFAALSIVIVIASYI